MATQRADRPEIVAAVKDRINAPIGSIAHRFFPIIRAADKTGSIYYKTLDADATAETRADAYAEWTRATLAEAVETFAAAEVGKAYTIPEDREKTYGGIDPTDRIGVTAACRSVRRGYEKAGADLVLADARYNDGAYLKDGQVLIGIQNAALSVGRYWGRTVLAASTLWLQRFVLASDVSAKLTALIGNSFNAASFADAVAGAPNAALGMLRAFLPFDEILVGDDDFWSLTDKTDAAIVARLPPADFGNDPEEMEMTMREHPIHGVSVWWQPDPQDRDILFQARSFFDDANDNNVYKAKGWYQLKQLNSGAMKVVKFMPTAVSTTTTTTSTAG